MKTESPEPKSFANSLCLCVSVAILLAFTGCTLVPCNHVFPKLDWYWSSEAKACRESKFRCLLYDTVEKDYWTGKAHQWSWDIANAKHLTNEDAFKVLQKMRDNEEGGYANTPDSESKFPIEVRQVVEEEMRFEERETEESYITVTRLRHQIWGEPTLEELEQKSAGMKTHDATVDFWAEHPDQPLPK